MSTHARDVAGKRATHAGAEGGHLLEATDKSPLCDTPNRPYPIVYHAYCPTGSNSASPSCDIIPAIAIGVFRMVFPSACFAKV